VSAAAPYIVTARDELLSTAGVPLGPTDWLLIDQKRIDDFASATGDFQWIHVDAERAQSGPYGTTIAHGFLTLSLANLFLPQLIEVRGATLGVNYGCDRVRFPTPVTVQSAIRGVGQVMAVSEVPGGAQIIVRVTIEIRGVEKPGCVVDTISRYYFA
jgi:acyl dehydratase